MLCLLVKNLFQVQYVLNMHTWYMKYDILESDHVYLIQTVRVCYLKCCFVQQIHIYVKGM